LPREMQDLQGNEYLLFEDEVHLKASAEVFRQYLNGPEVAGSAARPHEVLLWSKNLDERRDGHQFWSLVTSEWGAFDAIPHEDFAKEFHRFRASRPQLPN